MTNRIWLALAIVALLSAAGLIVCSTWIDIPFASRDLDREWARAEKNGYPLVADDLKPIPPVRDEDNAAPLLAEAERLVDPGLLTELDGLDRPLEAGGPTPGKMKDLVKRAGPALGVLRRAVEKPALWVPKDYDDSFALLFPECRTFKALAKALAARAAIAGQAHEWEAAVADLRTGRRLAALVSTQPTIISEFVGLAIDNIVNKAVGRIAACAGRDGRALALLRVTAVEGIPLKVDIRTGLRGEMYMELAFMRNYSRYRRDPESGDLRVDPSVPVRRSGQPASVAPRAWLARGMMAWNDVLESPEWKSGDPLEISQVGKRVDAKYWASGRHKLSYALWSVMFPAFGETGKAIVRGSARRTVLDSLLKVLEYRASHGAFPKTLTLAGADAPDPLLQGAKLRYRAGNGTVKVWSVGIDGKDDDGDPKNEHDTVFAYPPLPGR